MNSDSVPAVNPAKGWKIALFSTLLAGISMAFSLIGEAPLKPETKRNMNSMDVVSGVFKEQERHFQENDKRPVIQWIEQTRIKSKLDGHCVVLVKEKGSNADLIIPELANFLRSSGYEVTTDSVKVKLPRELLGLRFDVEKNCVMVHIGII